jgi:hypothetical protein
MPHDRSSHDALLAPHDGRDHHIAGWAEQLRLDRQRAAATAAQPKGWLATFLVLLAMAGITGVGVVAADAAEDLPPRPIEVASGVIVTPAAGWEFVGRSDDGGSILLTRGSGNVGVSVVAGEQPPDQVLRDVLATWTSEPGTTISVSQIHESGVRPGAIAARAAYAGTFAELTGPIEGEVTAVDGTGLAVVFDGWAGPGEYRLVRGEIDEMIRAAAIP